MAGFATESDVRTRLQISDTGIAPQDLVTTAIDEAHAYVAARLAPDVDLQSPPDAVRSGETLFAGAIVLRAIATKSVARTERITVGGQRIEAGGNFSALLEAAAEAEREAWELLAPYLASPDSLAPGRVTAPVDVLGSSASDA